jgi:hypothetical protein
MNLTLLPVLGALGSVVTVALVVVAAAVGLASPFLLVSVVLNVRKIARELQRANDYREHYAHGVRPGPLGT